MLLNITRRDNTPTRNNPTGMAGVNEDAMKAVALAGGGANCKFVPYENGGGGHNVCDIGDGTGYAYGAELLARPGGATLALNESKAIPAGIQAANAESAKIAELIASGEYQRMAVANRARICILEPWTCPPATTGAVPANTVVRNAPAITGATVQGGAMNTSLMGPSGPLGNRQLIPAIQTPISLTPALPPATSTVVTTAAPPTGNATQPLAASGNQTAIQGAGLPATVTGWLDDAIPGDQSGIPTWVWGAGALGLAWLIFRGGK